MLRFVELEDGSYRLTIEIEDKGNLSFHFEGRFQQVELKDIPEKVNGFKFETEVQK